MSCAKIRDTRFVSRMDYDRPQDSGGGPTVASRICQWEVTALKPSRFSVFALWAGQLCGAEPARKRDFLGWFQTRDICDSAGTSQNLVIKCT